jgi:hypothetical protein
LKNIFRFTHQAKRPRGGRKANFALFFRAWGSFILIMIKISIFPRELTDSIFNAKLFR